MQRGYYVKALKSLPAAIRPDTIRQNTMCALQGRTLRTRWGQQQRAALTISGMGCGLPASSSAQAPPEQTSAYSSSPGMRTLQAQAPKLRATSEPAPFLRCCFDQMTMSRAGTGLTLSSVQSKMPRARIMPVRQVPLKAVQIAP